MDTIIALAAMLVSLGIAYAISLTFDTSCENIRPTSEDYDER